MLLLICQIGDTVSHYGPVTFSSKPTQINTCSESKCSSTAQLGLRKHRRQERKKLLPTASAPCWVMVFVTLCERQQPARPLRELQAGLCGWVFYICRVSKDIWNNLCPCNIRQVAICRTPNLSILRNTYKHNHFLWKNLSFQPLFIYDAAQSRTGNVWYLCIINNKTRTECSLLLDVTYVAGNLLCWSMMVRGWVSS